ncbi:sugar phosphate isomerase/epimerase family protein [Mangrovivirga cuniculi]|uniref:Sugar phosphate isomerase n=1 Tax=Mangrovivirga cuniculi TaxID=2715131 RepID=A0A4D7JN77_9BACT|nr:sugar phosphate isomerase/epimerase [Mangrovivirga cuniculi]QCK17081.1 sugar phosphate isomerase [Mangrovivirga cuniculi]
MKNIIKTLVAFIIIISVSDCKQKGPDDFGGINLYTFREELKSNPKEVLRNIKAVGYKYIEDAGYLDGKFYGMTPTEFKEYLDELNSVPVSSHQGGITFDNADQIISDVKTVGYKYLVIPIPPMGLFTVDNESGTMGMTGGLDSLAQILNEFGKKCNKAGLKLLYHNHDFEFKENDNGIVPMDYLLENTDSTIVNFEIDLYWAVKAGADPVKYFKKYPGRFKAWHLKDMDSQGRFAPVGEGQLDFARYLSYKDLAGMKYYFVEQDETYDGMTPLKAIEISHKALKDLGFQ